MIEEKTFDKSAMKWKYKEAYPEGGLYFDDKITVKDIKNYVNEKLKDTPIESPFKYNEKVLLDEFKTYVESTYKGHYIGANNIQSLDLIFATGRGEGFCVGNILKYAARAGKKAGQHRSDLLKVLHYGLLALYLHDEEQKKKDFK